jgi:hypothetical protein
MTALVAGRPWRRTRVVGAGKVVGLHAGADVPAFPIVQMLNLSADEMRPLRAVAWKRLRAAADAASLPAPTPSADAAEAPPLDTHAAAPTAATARPEKGALMAATVASVRAGQFDGYGEPHPRSEIRDSFWLTVGPRAFDRWGGGGDGRRGGRQGTGGDAAGPESVGGRADAAAGAVAALRRV